MAGSTGEVIARDWPERLMTESGLSDVHSEPFDFDNWIRGSAQLHILGDPSRDIDCLGLWGSPQGVVEGELLDPGNGTTGDYAGQWDNIPGRIVMLSSKRPAYAGRQPVPVGETGTGDSSGCGRNYLDSPRSRNAVGSRHDGVGHRRADSGSEHFERVGRRAATSPRSWTGTCAA